MNEPIIQSCRFNPDNAPAAAAGGQPAFGAYKGICTSVVLHESKKTQGQISFRLGIRVSEDKQHNGENIGRTLTIFATPPQGKGTAEDALDRFFKATMISFGHDPMLIKGLTTTDLNGNKCFLHNDGSGRTCQFNYEPYDPGVEGSNSEVAMLSVDEYAEVLSGTLAIRKRNTGARAAQVMQPGGRPVGTQAATDLGSGGNGLYGPPMQAQGGGGDQAAAVNDLLS